MARRRLGVPVDAITRQQAKKLICCLQSSKQTDRPGAGERSSTSRSWTVQAMLASTMWWHYHAFAANWLNPLIPLAVGASGVAEIQGGGICIRHAVRLNKSHEENEFKLAARAWNLDASATMTPQLCLARSISPSIRPALSLVLPPPRSAWPL